MIAYSLDYRYMIEKTRGKNISKNPDTCLDNFFLLNDNTLYKIMDDDLSILWIHD